MSRAPIRQIDQNRHSASSGADTFGRLLLPSPALAATYQLSGKVTDQSSNPIVGTTIAVIEPSTSATVASTTTDSSGNYDANR